MAKAKPMNAVPMKDVPMVDVPEVEAEAYNPDRPISGLIHMQLVHLSAAEQRFPLKQRTGINIARLHTEAEAAEYIAKVTAMLHPQKKKSKARPAAKKAAKKSAPKSGTSRKAAKARR